MSDIRITSGSLRGRSIKSPKSSLTHPMGAREKLALFNMVADILPGAKVLDAFSGSGALGIEAVSRGADSAILIEKDKSAVRVILDNLKVLELAKKVQIFAGRVRDFETSEQFDIIIADPPYDKFDITEVSHLTKSLKDGGVFVLSHPDFAPVIDGLKLTKTRKYARANISIYAKTA